MMVLKLREECPEITQKDMALILGVSTRTVIRKLGQVRTEQLASI
jgi:DNA-binding XRE family transcriptional regulator